MDIKFEVHNVTVTQRAVKATVDGEEMSAIVPCAEVELTTLDDAHGSLTLRFSGKAMADAVAAFQPGGTVTWSLTASHGVPHAPAMHAPVASAAPAIRA